MLRVWLYRGVFERIHIFPPAINLDSAWVQVKEYVEQELQVDTREEPAFFDTWQADALASIYETQVEVVKECKRRKMNCMYNILIVVGDFADDPTVMHQSGGYSSRGAPGSMLNALYVRGRHAFTPP